MTSKQESSSSVVEPFPRQWIEGRYGPITIQRHSVMYEGKDSTLCVVVTAAVPVYKGIAIGVGATEDIALAALMDDLTGVKVGPPATGAQRGCPECS